MPEEHRDSWFAEYYEQWLKADNRVQIWRDRGLSWRDIEQLTGVSNSTLLRGHRGDHMWRPHTVRKILKAPHQLKLL